MSPIDSIGRLGVLPPSAGATDRSGKPASPRPFSRAHNESTSVDGMRRAFGNLFHRTQDAPDPGSQGANQLLPYVRHHGPSPQANAMVVQQDLPTYHQAVMQEELPPPYHQVVMPPPPYQDAPVAPLELPRLERR